jgi:hypothetical protein
MLSIGMFIVEVERGIYRDIIAMAVKAVYYQPYQFKYTTNN